MRRYIRHPADIPIQCSPYSGDGCVSAALCDFSSEGLSFCHPYPLEPGTRLTIRIDQVDPLFEGDVEVRWCRAAGDCYEVGARLLDAGQSYCLRMVEQLCYIEHYKREIDHVEHRHLSTEEAAREWIDLYAEEFSR